MHITHVVEDMTPESGGPPVVALELYRSSDDAGIIASIVTRTEKKAVHERARNFGIQDTTRIFSVGTLRILTDFKILMGLIRESDFLHFHCLWSIDTVVGYVLCKLWRTPYTVHVHGMLDPWSLAQSSGKKKIALALVFKRLLKNASFIICSTESEKQNVSKLDVNPDIVIVPNGVSVNGILDDKGDLFRREFPQIKGPYIYFLSRLHHKKGAMLLLEAFHQFQLENKEYSLIIAGSDEGEEENIVAYINKYALGDKVHVPGPMWGDIKSSAMNGSFCFCLPSYQEGFSMVILEAMAHGCCVLISDQCNFPEIGSEKAGLLTSPVKSDLVDSLNKLVKSSDDNKVLRENARELVLKKYVWSEVSSELASVYKAYGS